MRGENKVVASNEQTIYYKTGIIDYKKVVPFPQGLRFLVGSMTATQDEFRTAPGAVEGFECGNSSFNWDIPASCPVGLPAQRPLPGAQLLGRHQPGLRQPQEPHGVPGQR